MNTKSLRVPFNNLLPALDLAKEDVRAAINRVLSSGWYILGKELENFEQTFASYMNSGYAVGVASGTDAITLCLMALDLGPTDTVLTVANSAPPTVTAIRRAGPRVRFVDVDESGLMDVSNISEKDLKGVRAIVPVHLYGRMAKLHDLFEMAEANSVYIIEDAAQAHGSGNYGYRIGEKSIGAAFSFYPTKNLGCLGDGGAILTNNRLFADRLRILRNYGLKGPKQESYGLNSRLDEIQAAVLMARLPTLELINEYRTGVAAKYYEQLCGLKHCAAREPLVGDNHHLYPVFAEDRDALQKYLLTKGVQTGIHYAVPAHKQGCENYHPPLPRTEELCSKELSLPIWYGIGTDQVKYVCDQIKKFYGEK